MLIPHSGQNCADFATTVSQCGQNRCRFLYCWNSVSRGSRAPQVRQFLSAAVEGSPHSGHIRMFRMTFGPKPYCSIFDCRIDSFLVILYSSIVILYLPVL